MPLAPPSVAQVLDRDGRMSAAWRRYFASLGEDGPQGGGDGSDGGTTPLAPHHATHEPGGTDALVGAAWTPVENTFTEDQNIEGNLFVTGTITPPLRARMRDWRTGVGENVRMQISSNGDSGIVLTHDQVTGFGEIATANYADGQFHDLILEANGLHVQTGFTDPVEHARVHPSGGQTVGAPPDHGTDPGMGIVQARGLGTTPLNATNVTSGTLPDARLSANVQMKPIAASDLPTHHARHETGGADAIAALSAAVLTSGTLPDARLSTNVARRDQPNTFVADQTMQTTLAVGPTPAVTGVIRLPNNTSIAWRNAANTLDYAAVTLDASNLLVLGTNTAGVIAGARIRPVVDATHDLGSGALRWKDLYLSSGVSAAGVVTAGGGLGSTPLNASNLTSGTVPDARLSPNVQLKPIATADLPAGTVNASGTPAANQVALFVDADTVTGTPNLLWSSGAAALDLVAGRIHFPGAQNPSSDLSTLDDYREGPWTPFIGGVNGQSGQSYGTVAGTFTKIGRRCTANFWVSLLLKGTITGDVVIGGLPIACGDAAGAVTALLWNALATTWVNVVGLMQNGNNLIFLRGTSVGSTSNNTPLAAADVTNTTLVIGTASYLAAN